MSLHQAFSQATREVLAELLAPELAERMAEQIVARAQPEVEAALHEFLGFELQRATPAKAPRGRKRREATADGERASAAGHDGEPAPESLS